MHSDCAILPGLSFSIAQPQTCFLVFSFQDSLWKRTNMSIAMKERERESIFEDICQYRSAQKLQQAMLLNNVHLTNQAYH